MDGRADGQGAAGMLACVQAEHGLRHPQIALGLGLPCPFPAGGAGRAEPQLAQVLCISRPPGAGECWSGAALIKELAGAGRAFLGRGQPSCWLFAVSAGMAATQGPAAEEGEFPPDASPEHMALGMDQDFFRHLPPKLTLAPLALPGCDLLRLGCERSLVPFLVEPLITWLLGVKPSCVAIKPFLALI